MYPAFIYVLIHMSAQQQSGPCQPMKTKSLHPLSALLHSSVKHV